MTTIRTVDVTVGDPSGMKRILSAVNFAKNPRAVSRTGYSGGMGTGGAGSSSYPATGGPLEDAPTFFRRTITTPPTAGNISLILGATGITDIDPADIGTSMTLAVYARASKAHTGMNAALGWYNDAAFLSSTSGATTAVAANTWVRLTAIATAVPASTTRANLQVTVPVAGFSGALAVGDTIDVSAFLLYKPVAGFDGSYFDGSSDGALWEAAAHASRSLKIIGIG